MSLRLKLESKLNNLYSLHRDLESKYKRALEELSQQEIVSKQSAESIEKLAEEIYRLNTENIKKETTITSQENAIRTLEERVKR